jgi:hypothetical protein
MKNTIIASLILTQAAFAGALDSKPVTSKIDIFSTERSTLKRVEYTLTAEDIAKAMDSELPTYMISLSQKYSDSYEGYLRRSTIIKSVLPAEDRTLLSQNRIQILKKDSYTFSEIDSIAECRILSKSKSALQTLSIDVTYNGIYVKMPSYSTNRIRFNLDNHSYKSVCSENNCTEYGEIQHLPPVLQQSIAEIVKELTWAKSLPIKPCIEKLFQRDFGSDKMTVEMIYQIKKSYPRGF